MGAKDYIVAIFVIIIITLSMWYIWKANPRTIPDVNLQAKEQCIKNNGIPIDDSDDGIVDCRTYPVYPKVKPTIILTPVATTSIAPPPIIYNSSSSANF